MHLVPYRLWYACWMRKKNINLKKILTWSQAIDTYDWEDQCDVEVGNPAVQILRVDSIIMHWSEHYLL